MNLTDSERALLAVLDEDLYEFDAAAAQQSVTAKLEANSGARAVRAREVADTIMDEICAFCDGGGEWLTHTPDGQEYSVCIHEDVRLLSVDISEDSEQYFKLVPCDPP